MKRLVLSLIASAALLSGCSPSGEPEPAPVFRVEDPVLASAFDEAAARWEEATGISVVRSATGDIPVAFGAASFGHSEAEGALGGTAVKVWTDTGRKQLIGIHFQPNLEELGYSLRDAMLHELGHALRMDSAHAAGARDAMNAHLGPRDDRALTAGDVELVCEVRECTRFNPEVP